MKNKPQPDLLIYTALTAESENKNDDATKKNLYFFYYLHIKFSKYIFNKRLIG